MMFARGASHFPRGRFAVASGFAPAKRGACRSELTPLDRKRQALASEESLKRVEVLLARVEEVRARLEATTDPQEAVDVLAELAEIAKQVEAEVERARQEAESAGA